MKDERAEWNAKYRSGSHTSLEPDPFMVEAFDRFVGPEFRRGGKALDVAGGVGRHAIYLAQRGWHATLIDVSDEGIALARKNAAAAGVELQLQRVDLTTAELPEAEYDLVVVCFYLQRELFPALVNALRAGGVLIYKTYTEKQQELTGGASHLMYLLKRGELRQAFAELDELHYREHAAGKAVAEYVGRKRG